MIARQGIINIHRDFRRGDGSVLIITWKGLEVHDLGERLERHILFSQQVNCVLTRLIRHQRNCNALLKRVNSLAAKSITACYVFNALQEINNGAVPCTIAALIVPARSPRRTGTRTES